MTKLSELLVTKETSVSSMYRSLLGNSKYSMLFWDDFKNSNNIASTAMVKMPNGLSFTAGNTLESINTIDAELGSYEVSECFVVVNFIDSGIPLIYVSADGGTNWEETANNVVHKFTNTGSDLRIKFEAGGSGEIYNWAILYKPDSKSYVEEIGGTTSKGGIDVVLTLPNWSIDYVGQILYVSSEKAFYACIDKWVKIAPPKNANLVSNSGLGCWSASGYPADFRTASDSQFDIDLGDWVDASENAASIAWVSGAMNLTVVDGATFDIAKASLDFNARGGWFYRVEFNISANTFPNQTMSIAVGNWLITNATQPMYPISYFFSPKKDGDLLSFYMAGNGSAGPFSATIDYITIYECGPAIVNNTTDAIDGEWSKSTGAALYRDYIRDGELPDSVYCMGIVPYSSGGGEGGGGGGGEIYVNYPSISKASNSNWLNNFKNHSAAFGIWVYSSVADTAKISLVHVLSDDSVVKTSSAYHPGDSAWHWIEVSVWIPSDAKAVYSEIYIETTVGSETTKVACPIIIQGTLIGENNYYPMENDSPVLLYSAYSTLDSSLIANPWDFFPADIQVLTEGKLPFNIASFKAIMQLKDTNSFDAYYVYVDFYDEYQKSILYTVSIAGQGNNKIIFAPVALNLNSDKFYYFPAPSDYNTMSISEFKFHMVTLS